MEVAYFAGLFSRMNSKRDGSRTSYVYNLPITGSTSKNQNESTQQIGRLPEDKGMWKKQTILNGSARLSARVQRPGRSLDMRKPCQDPTMEKLDTTKSSSFRSCEQNGRKNTHNAFNPLESSAICGSVFFVTIIKGIYCISINLN